MTGQTKPRTPMGARNEIGRSGSIPEPYRFQCVICEGLLDCREAHTLYVNGQRAHNVCVEARAQELARRYQSSIW